MAPDRGCLPGGGAVVAEFSKGQVPTAGQWNSFFAGKQDALGYVPLNVAGGVMTGRLVTAPPGAATAGFNLTPGTVPANPLNGDLWATPAGLFARVNGSHRWPVGGCKRFHGTDLHRSERSRAAGRADWNGHPGQSGQCADQSD